ncbi:hypothetical protein I3842_03G213800 [Carya illinoinensis]|nr:hypothetical protein I3842_03G213800 [Carya illinoinensis]KAG6723543.1 hypothetical protein I3842_03G213800 [Carya illinoinensis]
MFKFPDLKLIFNSNTSKLLSSQWFFLVGVVSQSLVKFKPLQITHETSFPLIYKTSPETLRTNTNKSENKTHSHKPLIANSTTAAITPPTKQPPRQPTSQPSQKVATSPGLTNPQIS